MRAPAIAALAVAAACAGCDDARELAVPPPHPRALADVPDATRHAAFKTEVTARVNIDPRRGSIAVEADMTVSPGGLRYLVFDFLAADTIAVDGVAQLAAGEQTACRFARAGDRLIVELARVSDPVTVRFRYAGTPGDGGGDVVSGDAVLLHDVWLPYVGGAAAWHVTAMVAADDGGFELLGPVTGGRDGDALAWDVDAAERFPIAGAPAFAHERFEHRGVAVDVALAPEHAGEAMDVETAVRAALDAYAPLDPFPRRHLHIAESSVAGTRRALAFHSLIVLGGEVVTGPEMPGALAHEIAHLWFGVDVRDKRGRWSEAVASYLSQWALADWDAQQLRWSWAVGYEQVSDRRDVALAWGDEPIDDAGLRTALYYGKGGLVLTALEDRVGREAVAAALRRLATGGDGRDVTWRDVVAAVADETSAEDAAWLETWLGTVGAPDFRLVDVTRRGGRLTGVLTQQDGSPFAGTVELGVLGKGREPLAVERVAFAGKRTPFAIAAPRGAAFLVVDPRHRMPKKPDLDAPPRWAVKLRE